MTDTTPSETANTPTYSLHPNEPRWTHMALRVSDMDATVAWFEEFTPLVLIDRRADDDGYGGWLGMPGETNNPFILVLAQFFPDKDPFGAAPRATLAPFAHLGMEMPKKSDIDDIAERAKAAGCLAMPPTQMPAPIGYITMLHDPDGNTIEFSWDQGVYATLAERWSAS